MHYVNTGLEFVRGIYEFMSDGFIKQWHKELVTDESLINSLPLVNCVPMKSLLKRLSIRVIDIWILDTEGAEESVLLGTDFTRFNFICMECDSTDPSKNKKKVALIEKQKRQRNCMCKRDEFKPSSLERAHQSKFRTWGYSDKARAQGHFIPNTTTFPSRIELYCVLMYK